MQIADRCTRLHLLQAPWRKKTNNTQPRTLDPNNEFVLLNFDKKAIVQPCWQDKLMVGGSNIKKNYNNKKQGVLFQQRFCFTASSLTVVFKTTQNRTSNLTRSTGIVKDRLVHHCLQVLFIFIFLTNLSLWRSQGGCTYGRRQSTPLHKSPVHHYVGICGLSTLLMGTSTVL